MENSVKKNVLVVVPRMPYPLNSGGRIAIYETIKSLSINYQLSIIIIDDNSDSRKHLVNMQEFSTDITLYTPYKLRFIINALWGLLRGMPLQAGYFYFNHIQKLVTEKASKCDFFFAFMIRTTSYGLKLPIKKVHYAIDSMYLNYKKSEENTTSVIWKMIYKVEIPLLYKAELAQVKNYDLTTFVNSEEAAFWKKHGNVETLPHGIERKTLLHTGYDEQYKNVVAFIGRMDYRPNIEAVMWFCKNVAEKLEQGIEFWIIGGFATETVKKLSGQYANVKIMGFVDDPEKILKSCICTVAPMQSGGGLQTKILMAMALESIVITTSLPVAAIEGAQNMLNLIVEDNPEKFGYVINEIYNHPQKYYPIKKMAKELIAKKYALDVIEGKLFSLIENL